MPYFIVTPALPGRDSTFSIWTSGFATREEAADAAVELQKAEPTVIVEAADLREAVQYLLLPPVPRRPRRRPKC